MISKKKKEYVPDVTINSGVCHLNFGTELRHTLNYKGENIPQCDTATLFSMVYDHTTISRTTLDT